MLRFGIWTGLNSAPYYARDDYRNTFLALLECLGQRLPTLDPCLDLEQPGLKLRFFVLEIPELRLGKLLVFRDKDQGGRLRIGGCRGC